MRIVWTSAAFLCGVASAVAFGIAPGHALPSLAFLGFVSATVLVTISLVVSRKRAAVALLCLVFLIGLWRGGDAIEQLDNTDGRPAPSATVMAQPQTTIDHIRSEIADILRNAPGASDTGLPAALLVGDRSGISHEDTQNFRSAGLAHLLAISGLHVSLLGGSAMALSVSLMGRRRSFYLLIPLLVVIVYAALAGFAPPITRAAIMFTAYVMARSLGRGSHTVAALALAAMGMVAVSPEIIASLSFQLSFAAMLGIAVIVPVFDGFNEITKSDEKTKPSGSPLDRVRRLILGSLAVSVASTLGTLPLIALHFESVPIWGPVATLFALPAVPTLVLSSIALVLTSQIPIPMLLELAAIPTDASSAYITRVAQVFSNLPPKPIESGSWTTWMAVAYYALFGSMIVGWRLTSSFAKRTRDALLAKLRHLDRGTVANPKAPFWFTGLLVMAGIFTWGAAISQPNGEPYLSVRFLETYRGESILIETPNGNRVVIDGGESETEIADSLTQLIPWNDREIDVVMLTHPDADHVGGLPEILKRFRTDAIIHPGLDASSGAFSSWMDALQGHDNVHIARQGSQIFLDENTYLEIVTAGCPSGITPCPTEINDASIVSRLSYGEISFLFTADIEKQTEAILVATNPNLSATVLKAPHHGSITSSTEALLEAVNPSAIVVAVGTANRHGHPDQDVMARLNRSVGEQRVFRTDQMGTLEFRTDGQRLWLIR